MRWRSTRSRSAAATSPRRYGTRSRSGCRPSISDHPHGAGRAGPVRQPSSPKILLPIPDFPTTIAAILPELAAIAPPPSQILAEILAVALEVRPLPLSRLRVSLLDVLLDLPPISGDVASVSSDTPGIAPGVAPILPDLPRGRLDILRSRDGRAQSHRQRATCQHGDQSSH